MDNLLEELQPIFQEILEQPHLTIDRNSNAMNTTNWDSLAHIEIIEVIELEFKIKFTLSELESIRNVGDLVDLIVAKSA